MVKYMKTMPNNSNNSNGASNVKHYKTTSHPKIVKQRIPVANAFQNFWIFVLRLTRISQRKQELNTYDIKFIIFYYFNFQNLIISFKNYINTQINIKCKDLKETLKIYSKNMSWKE